MTNLIPFQSLTMTSREIANLTGKQHSNVMRDIRAMIERFEESADPNLDQPLGADSNLNWHCETETYADEQGKLRQMYRLDKNTTICLISGYDPIPRMRIIQRLEALESGTLQPARFASHLTAKLKYKEAEAIAASSLKIYKMLGTDVQMARTLTVEAVKDEVGLDLSKALANNTVEEAPMTSTDLGKAWGLDGGNVGAKMNIILRDQGYAEKNEHGDWIPTEKGKPYATVNPYKSPNSHHTGYRTLWYQRILDVLVREYAA